jgi:hypothetical protein
MCCQALCYESEIVALYITFYLKDINQIKST